ncbi:Phage-related baseplate assembly protein [Acinetobacter venetianus]|uniref:Phage-related baseplate assembly protein n=1 Tax=Acinetobacter venetianus TaxID=52133 RepID=A0A150HM43_9GAMM|nr:phage baseplate assembly protein V [Acinetobacter venetianus]KXZ66793.1 Phage-related baseplate assembly protein [Acinetobacter venetianus]
MSYAAAQIDRILANLVRFGRVVTVDYSQAVATVDFDGELVEGIEWLKQRAGDDRSWTAPSEDEYVVVLSASGDLSQGVILGALAQSKFPNAGTDANPVTVYSDGTTIHYDKTAHILTVDCSASNGVVNVLCNQANVTATASVLFDTPQGTFTGNLSIGGSLSVTGASSMSGNVEFKGGSVKHGGKEIGGSHTHSGVQTGGGNTGAVN